MTLFAYWGWFCLKEADGEETFYDWISDVLDWEEFQ